MTSSSLTAEVPEGDANLASLFARYRSPLLRYFIRKGHTVEIAEDCVQDVFLRLTRSDLSKIENVEAFFFTVASSVAADLGRKMRSRHALQHDSINNLDFESREASPSRVLEDKEALVRLSLILDELKPRTRDIFLLNRLDGLTYTQLAARFGIGVAAVEKQMSKALAHIRRRFLCDE